MGYKLTEKDTKGLAKDLGMPIDEINSLIDDMNYIDSNSLNTRIFGL